MSLTRTIFDKNAYRAQLLRSTGPIKYNVNNDYPSIPTTRPDHLNGFHSKHAAPELVDHESDLYSLDSVLSNDPYYQFPKTNAVNQHSVPQEPKNKFPSIQYSRLNYYYNISELSYNRHSDFNLYFHPIHSNNYIGTNSRELGRYSNKYTPTF